MVSSGKTFAYQPRGPRFESHIMDIYFFFSTIIRDYTGIKCLTNITEWHLGNVHRIYAQLDWNELPAHVISAQTTSAFRARLARRVGVA